MGTHGRRSLLIIGLLVLPSLATEATELLGPQDDAGSGKDAGDDFDGALAIPLGLYQGNVTKGADQFDYYAVELRAGWWYEVFVRSEVDLICTELTSYCLVTGDCAEMSLFAPNQSLWTPGGCWTAGPGHYYASFTQWFVAPESGTWYVGVTPGTRNVVQAYLLRIRAFAPHDHVFHAQVEDLRWLALRLDGNIGAYTAVVETQLGFDGSLDPTRMGLFLPLNEGDYDGYFSSPSAYYASAANAGVELGPVDVGLEGDVATRGDFQPGGGVLLSWGKDGARFEGKVIVYASSARFGARVTVGYNGTEPPILVEGHDDGPMVEKRITDFDADVSMEAPIGGYTEGASMTLHLSDAFVGFFQLSPQLGTALPESSVGGYVDPLGRRVQLATPEHPEPVAPLIRPLPGAWRFWFDEDYGVNGQPTLVFGLYVPDWILRP